MAIKIQGDTIINDSRQLIQAGEIRVAGGTGASYTVDLSAGNYFTRTFNNDATITITNPLSSGTASSFLFDVTNAGNYIITWPESIVWAKGTAPTLTAAGRDILGFITHDGGTTWAGLVLGKDIK